MTDAPVTGRSDGAWPTLSVIIATRDRPGLLAHQLSSVASQHYGGPWEVIVADNASAYPLDDIVAQYAGAVRYRVVRIEKVVGAPHAKNTGASAAQGDALIFLDDDDELATGYLEAMGSALRCHELVAARVEHSKLNDGRFGDQSRNHFQTDGLMETPFLPSASGCSLGVQRSTFEAVGGFSCDLLHAQDIDLCWRVQLRGSKLQFVPGAVVHYRHRTTLRDIFTQERSWGVADAQLYARWRHLHPRRSLRAARNDWLTLFNRAVHARDRGDIAWCVGSLGRRLGRLEGSVRYRTLFP